jgi:hypothetical protein
MPAARSSGWLLPGERTTAIRLVHLSFADPEYRRSMNEPRERDQRFAEVQRALDESDREERTEEEEDLEAMAQKWERVVRKDASSEDS